MKTIAKWFFVGGFLFSSWSLAAGEELHCQFSKRNDETSTRWSDELEKDVSISAFEDVSDFVFEDYPWLSLKAVTGGWEVSIGAMAYGEGRFSSEPSTIQKSQTGEVALFSYDNPEGDNKWQIRIDLKTRLANLTAEDDDGKFVDTAEFVCE